MSSSLTIIVPVYNEERTLASVMAAMGAKCPDAHIIYVDDGSKDSSLSILQSGAQAAGTYTVIQDADLEYDPAEIKLLVDTANANPGCAIFGSRFLRPNPNIYKRFLLGNKVLTLVFNLLYGTRITDSYTCYKLLPTDLFRSLELTARGFELEAEICAQCVKHSIPIKEIPISYHPRTIAEGKKINGRDAWKGLKMMIKLRFSGTPRS
jgi:glycosyltransferase involved in cell wall biosynthesis